MTLRGFYYSAMVHGDKINPDIYCQQSDGTKVYQFDENMKPSMTAKTFGSKYFKCGRSTSLCDDVDECCYNANGIDFCMKSKNYFDFVPLKNMQVDERCTLPDGTRIKKNDKKMRAKYLGENLTDMQEVSVVEPAQSSWMLPALVSVSLGFAGLYGVSKLNKVNPLKNNSSKIHYEYFFILTASSDKFHFERKTDDNHLIIL
jgi:hypothetical protein